VDNLDTMQRDGEPPPSRRGILGALGLGGAALVASAVAASRPAAAQAPDTTTANTGSAGTQPVASTAPSATTVATTTTTAPPRRPTADDLPLIGAARVFELAAAEVYSRVSARIDEFGFDDATKAFVGDLSARHRAYAEQLGAVYGPGAPFAGSDKIAQQLGAEAIATATGPQVLQGAQAVEEAAVDTHLELLGQIQSVQAATLIASIQIIEARHAATLASLQSTPYDASAPAVEDGADAITAGA
jgi:hypothetical protein